MSTFETTSATFIDVRDSSEELAVRLLSQGDWGVSRQELDAFLANYKKTDNSLDTQRWLEDEMAKPQVLLRDYFRRRSNPRTPLANEAGSVRGACDVQSRWLRYAFNRLDVRKTVSVSSNQGTITLSSNGVTRAQIAEDSFGVVTMEYFMDIGGWEINNLLQDPKYTSDSPDFTVLTPTFELAQIAIPALSDSSLPDLNEYGVRAHARLRPTTTGDYTFYLSADDSAILYVDSRERARVSSNVPRYTYDEQEGQESVPLRLNANQDYMIQVVFKESWGAEHFSVAWTGPGMNSITVLAAPYLLRSADAPAIESSYLLCLVDEHAGLGGLVALSSSSSCSFNSNMGSYFDFLYLPNPSISFTNVDSTYTTTWSSNQATFTPVVGSPGVEILTSLDSAAKSSCDETGRAADAFVGYDFGTGNGVEYMRLDPRLKLLENTLSAPVDVESEYSGQCPSVPRTFVNEAYCIPRDTCAPLNFQAATVSLDEATLKYWYSANSIPVYYMDQLENNAPFDEGPCRVGRTRWKLQNDMSRCPHPATLSDGNQFQDANTAFILMNHLRKSTDKNPYIRDLSLSTDVANLCQDSSAYTAGLRVQVESRPNYPTQHVTFEYFDNIAGWSVDDFTQETKYLQDNPDQVLTQPEFSHPSAREAVIEFGVRARVYVIPPSDGEYTFFIASDDRGKLSVDSNEVASVSDWVPYRSYEEPEQGSGPLTLQAGRRYLVEALVKQSTAGHHMTVAWTGPGIPALTTLGAPYIETYVANPPPYSPPATIMQCWEHVQEDMYSVRDASQWMRIHPGNMVAFEQGKNNPIERTALNGEAKLNYPHGNDMGRWDDHRWQLPEIGRFGDSISFGALPTNLQTREMATRVGAVGTPTAAGFEACGSAGEAANDPVLGHQYAFSTPEDDDTKIDQLDHPYPLYEGKSMLFNNVILKEDNALRSRMAWALSQIFTVSDAGLDFPGDIELWANYFDIFVRHAFGNYRDILKEVAYSPVMGAFLTYVRNKAYSYNNNFPDENFAREIMQLFSIGLWNLNEDGSQSLDADGIPQPTYTNDHIVAMARVWTGMDYQSHRGNKEIQRGIATTNYIDPMQIKPEWKDRMPKINLEGGYLGDSYPLCSELHDQHFLTKGAKFILTGSVSLEGSDYDSATPESGVGRRGRFAPDPSASALYAELCRPDSNDGGRCSYPTEVVLSQNLNCHGGECNAGAVRVVQVNDPVAARTMYYTYVSVPCVRLALFQGGRAAKYGDDDSVQCANPASRVGVSLCCEAGDPTTLLDLPSYGPQCLFASEKMSYAVAEQRCVAAGGGLCEKSLHHWHTFDDSCGPYHFAWRSTACALQIQVFPNEKGSIAVVDALSGANLLPEVELDSKNFFRVHWKDGAFPQPSNPVDCGVGCLPGTGGTCVCNIEVEDSVIYASSSAISSAWDMRKRLAIGAPDPQTLSAGYTRTVLQDGDGFEYAAVWTKSASTSWDMQTIFEMPPLRVGTRKLFFFNRESMVYAGEGKRFSFRNPPTFMPFVGEYEWPWVQHTPTSAYIPAIENEVDSLLDLLFEHNSTAPFVVYRLIQRLVTSNPTPRYVKATATAFRTGLYGSIGSGRYGCLQATTAALLLDREARSAILDKDRYFGRVLEPLEKIFKLLKVWEYKPKPGYEVVLGELDALIGQAAFKARSVFGFYLPEFSADGKVADAQLVSPEAQLVTTPNVINFLNGVNSLIDIGLSSCDDGFGISWGTECSPVSEAVRNNEGALQFSHTGSASGLIDELDLLLTSRRLASENKVILEQVYDTAYAQAVQDGAQDPAAEARKAVQKMFTLTSEFHTIGGHTLNGKQRAELPKTQSLGRPYKAIVVVFQNGGFDSYNMIVPHSSCTEADGSTAKDYYQEYLDVRTGAAIAKQADSERIAATSDQPCDYFQIHPSLSVLRDLYNQGDAAFMANIGALVEPVTKAEYQSGQKELPPSLFAHNVMQKSMHSCDPSNINAKGVLGRMVEVLLNQSQPFASELYSLVGNVKMLEGVKPPDIVGAWDGVKRYNEFETFGNTSLEMNKEESEFIMSDTLSALLKSSLERSEELGGKIETVTLATSFDDEFFSKQLEQVSKLIKLRSELETERAVFFTELYGYDTHSTFNLPALLDPINRGMQTFVTEMKSQVWKRHLLQFWNPIPEFYRQIYLLYMAPAVVIMWSLVN